MAISVTGTQGRSVVTAGPLKDRTRSGATAASIMAKPPSLPGLDQMHEEQDGDEISSIAVPIAVAAG